MPLIPNIFSFDLIKSLKRTFCTAHPAPYKPYSPVQDCAQTSTNFV